MALSCEDSRDSHGCKMSATGLSSFAGTDASQSRQSAPQTRPTMTTILIVDDESIVREVVAQYLRQDGLEVCRRIRSQSNVPVIMVTAKGDETDTIIGLGVGADDYVSKPFSPRELVARVKAVLRRAST